MNKVLEASGHGRRFNSTLVFVSCFIWLAYNLLSLLGIIVLFVAVLGSPCDATSAFFGSIYWGLWCVFTIVIYWIINRNVREFMDIMARMEGARCSEPQS